MDNLDQTTTYIADYVLKLPEFVRFQKAAEKMEKSSDDLNILQDMQERLQTVATLQQSGLPISEDQHKKLEEARAKLNASEICMEYLRAQNAAISAARKICNDLTSATGIPFAGGGGGCCG